MSRKKSDQQQKPKAPEKKKSVPHTIDPEKNRNRTILFLIFIVCFLLYGNTIPNEFAMDDELVTLDHPIVQKGISGIPKIFASRYVANDKQSYEYRPIVQVSFAIEHQFTGGDPHMGHFINIILYALTGVVLYFLLSRLFLNFHWILPASTTFLFLIHPIHSEVVASLKNRDEILSFLFTLLSIRAFLNYFDKGKYVQIAYGLLFFLLAILSKKSALPLVFTLPLTLYFFKNLDLKKALLFIAFPVAVLLVYRLFMMNMFEQVNRDGLYFENPFYVDKPGFFGKLPMIFYTMGYYIKLLILPYPLLVYYGYDQVDIAGWGHWAVWVSMIGLMGATVYSILKLKEKNILIFGFLYFLINIGTFSNLIPMPGIIAERFAYGASLGFCIMVCYGAFALLKVDISKNAKLQVPNALKYSFFAIGLISLVYIFQRNKDWENHLTIYQADSAKAPRSAKIHALIGGYCMQTMERYRMNTDPNKKKITEAEMKNYIALSKQHFNDALSVYPDYGACLNNLGTLYFSYIGEIDSAAMYFEKTLKLEPDHVQAHYNLGSCYEIYYNAEKLMESYFNTLKSDSAAMAKDGKEYKKYFDAIRPLFRTSTVAFGDISQYIQQFIQQSRQTGGKGIDINTYINGIDQYWEKVLQKNKVDVSQSIKPGAAILQVVTTTTSPNQNEFMANIQNAVNKLYVQQFTPLLSEKFEIIFNRKPDSTDYSLCAVFMADRLQSTKNKMISEYYTSLFVKEIYPQAYNKLTQIYTNEQMWDSLININSKVVKSESIKRYVDIYRLNANAYYNKKQLDKALKYFTLTIEDEEKIYKKAVAAMNIQNGAGNTLAASKLSLLVQNARSDIFNIYNSMSYICKENGDEAKANEYLLKAQAYQ